MKIETKFSVGDVTEQGVIRSVWASTTCRPWYFMEGATKSYQEDALTLLPELCDFWCHSTDPETQRTLKRNYMWSFCPKCGEDLR